MQIEGKLVQCDYPGCSAQILLKKEGDKELDGGYTIVSQYEAKPDNWGFREGKDLCPDHFQYYQDMLNEFWNPVEPAHAKSTGISGELAADVEADNDVQEPKDDLILYTNMPEMNVHVTGPTGTVDGHTKEAW